MHIVIFCPGMPFHGATLAEGKSLGGSESAAYYTARELAGLGHLVTVFTSIPNEQEGVWDGVRYLSAGPSTRQTPLGSVFEWYASTTPHDLLIIQRVPHGFHRPYASKVNLWWSHDLALRRSQPQVAGQLWNVDRVLAVSDFHRRQMARMYALPEGFVSLMANGVDPELFPPAADEEEAAAWRRSKLAGGVLVYSSRPERGLVSLVEAGGVMERLWKKDKSITLKVAGYDNTTPAMQPLYDHLWARCRELPNVELLGPLSKHELARVMRGAWCHLYPTDFEEVSCITAMEAQSAGNPILTTPVAALPETLSGGGVVWLEQSPAESDGGSASEPSGGSEKGDWVDGIVGKVLELKANPARWEELHHKALAKAAGYSWRAGAAGLADMARSILKEKSSPPDRLARHLLRHSDILALGRLADKTRLGQTPPGEDVLSELDTRYRFVQTGDFVRHNEWISQWHLEKGIDPGLTNPKGLLEMARFQVVEELVSALPKGSRVLDYACGQGHFTLALAEKHPDLFFHGVDIAPSSIGVGRQKIVERKLNNVWLFDGQAENLDGEFDLILALEVMEHVQEPGHLSNQLERVLAKGGALCLTVPYGPWEAESYDTMPFRAHIHHFDREDLSALWGHKPDYRVIAVPSRHTERDEPLGVYRVTFGAGGGPAGLLDWQAHLERQAPRETVSVCMIVTPKGLTLARTLESVGPFADQLVIGVDGPEAEGGPAWDIARRYGAEVFSIASPLKTGFDAARNGTLERAACDWVLWIDDDEVFEWPERLIKYLRPNPYQAYAIKQHHYAVEPEGIIKTDYPARLFRNKPGIRFFGVVHEHPETALNEGLGLVLMLPDVAICHNGYDTEDTRRKRFARNLPLMVRDRQTYPQRILGQFLWIRDLAQMNRYALEAGGEMTPAIHKRAVEAVSLWRDLVARDQLRMALDALPYYSDSVMLLTGEGIAFELALGAGRAGVGDTQPPQAPQVRGRFMDTGDIHNITRLMLREKTQFLEEKYF